MLYMPAKYKRSDKIDTKNFVSRDMTKVEKDRVKAALLSAELTWQITGEEIPSLVSEDYNCVAILGLSIKLKSIKDALFIAGLVQEKMKALCVIRLYDNTDELYSFAHKRLSRADKEQIVVLERVATDASSPVFPDDAARMLSQYLAFDALKNKSNKLALYLEAMVKAYIISNPSLYSGVLTHLDSKIWYNQDEFMALFEMLRKLEDKKAALKSAALPGEKAKLNGEIKILMEGLGV